VRLRVGTRLDHAIIALIIITLGFAYARTLAPGITWANNGADSGDLVTAAATLGVAHPTGYPTYLLLVRLFQFIPLGDLAFRANLFSMVAAMVAVVIVYAIVRQMLLFATWCATAAAGIAALAFGLSPVFWSQAVVAEVHSLNALFVALILLFTLRTLRQPIPVAWWSERFQGVAIGLALGNHITLLLPAAGWLVTTGLRVQQRQIVAIADRLLWIGIGLLVYLYLPLRAAAHPPINWGAPSDWESFWWVISGQPYHNHAFSLPSSLLSARLEAWSALLMRQFGVLGLALGFYALFYRGGVSRPFMWQTAGIALAYSVFAITYNTADSYAYLIPAYLIFAIWIGVGIHRFLSIVQGWNPRATVLAVLVLLIGFTMRSPHTAQEVDASHDYAAIAYAREVLAAAPAQAIVVTSSDYDTFPLWYYHFARGERPDLVIVVDPLLDFAWYRNNLRAVYPALQIPEQQTEITWVEVVEAANGGPNRVCKTDLNHDRRIICGGSNRQ
jgi:hypothetical protein